MSSQGYHIDDTLPRNDMSKVEHLGQVTNDFNIIIFCSLGITKCIHIVGVSGQHQKQKLLKVGKKTRKTAKYLDKMQNGWK